MSAKYPMCFSGYMLETCACSNFHNYIRCKAYNMHPFAFLQIAGASLFGILLSKYDPVTCLKLASGLMIFALPVLVHLFFSSLSLFYLFVCLFGPFLFHCITEIEKQHSGFISSKLQILLGQLINKLSSGVLDSFRLPQTGVYSFKADALLNPGRIGDFCLIWTLHFVEKVPISYASLAFQCRRAWMSSNGAG